MFKPCPIRSGMLDCLADSSHHHALQPTCRPPSIPPWRHRHHALIPGRSPWGLLAGSMAIEANLSAWEGQGLSAIVFAGAAQLVAIGMLKGGANLFSILLTTLLLTSQHLLYGLSMRPVLSGQPLRWRLGLGFLLTDEFFALTSRYDQQQFNRWYALGVGLTFYVAWNLFTLAGILLGQNIPHRPAGPGLFHRRHVRRVDRTAGAQPADSGVRGGVAVVFGAVQPLALGDRSGRRRPAGHERRLRLPETHRRPLMTWLLIFAMGLVVFLNRYAFTEPRLPLRLSSNARQFLGFAVPGMLTAICGPIIFLPGHQLDLSLTNPYLLGSLVAIARCC